MSFDWDQFRQLAEELRQRNDEAAQRTAISRIYYAFYWRARVFWRMRALFSGKMTVRIAKSGKNIKTEA